MGKRAKVTPHAVVHRSASRGVVPSRCSASAPTATTSRSAAAERLLRAAAAERRRVDVHWVVLSADARRAREARASAARVPRASASARSCGRAFRDGFFPFAGAAVKDFFEALKRAVAPDLIFTHYAATTCTRITGWSSRADLEHLPRPSDPRVRDPEIRRRSRRARTSSCRSDRRFAGAKCALMSRLSEPAPQALVLTPRPSTACMRLRGIECARRRAMPRRSTPARSLISPRWRLMGGTACEC